MSYTVLDFFYAGYPLFLIILGIICNSVVFVVFSRSKMTKIGISKFIRVMSISDTIALCVVIVRYLRLTFGISVLSVSNFTCKFMNYLLYSAAPVSGWILVYMSTERFLLIRYGNRVSLLKKNTFQYLIILAIVVYNIFLYLPLVFYYGLTEKKINGTNSSTYKCLSSDEEYFLSLNMTDLINASLLPFILMVISTMLLIYSIFRSRLRISGGSSPDLKKLKRDIQFSFTSISLNIIFLWLNLPICVVNLLDSYSDLAYMVVINLFYTNFAIPFFVHYFSNKYFKNELLTVFRLISLKDLNSSLTRNPNLTTSNHMTQPK